MSLIKRAGKASETACNPEDEAALCSPIHLLTSVLGLQAPFMGMLCGLGTN